MTDIKKSELKNAFVQSKGSQIVVEELEREYAAVRDKARDLQEYL